MSVVPDHAQLTTQQAADVLNVSRPYLIELLDHGRIEYRKVGEHRRIKASSLLEHERQDDLERREAADELGQWDVEAGSPDDFVVDRIHLDESIVHGEVVRIADSGKKPAQTVDDVLDQLENAGLVSSAALLRTH